MIPLLWSLATSRWTWIGLTVLGLSGGVGIQTQRLRTTRHEVAGLQAQLLTALEVNKTQSLLLSEQNQAVEKLKRDYDEAQVRLSQAESQASTLLDTARQRAAEMARQQVPRECDKAFKWALQQEMQTRRARAK